MPKLIKTRRAELDLIEIWTHIANDNPVAATKLIESLDERSFELLTHPKLGPARPDIAKGYRHMVMDNYLVLYRIIDEDIEVVRYVHGSRDLKSL